MLVSIHADSNDPPRAEGALAAKLSPACAFSMVRPRWHDALLVAGILAIILVGVWALWWDDVRRVLHLGPSQGSSIEPAPVSTDRT